VVVVEEVGLLFWGGVEVGGGDDGVGVFDFFVV